MLLRLRPSAGPHLWVDCPRQLCGHPPMDSHSLRMCIPEKRTNAHMAGCAGAFVGSDRPALGTDRKPWIWASSDDQLRKTTDAAKRAANNSASAVTENVAPVFRRRGSPLEVLLFFKLGVSFAKVEPRRVITPITGRGWLSGDLPMAIIAGPTCATTCADGDLEVTVNQWRRASGFAVRAI